jgi:hypothetical protein
MPSSLSNVNLSTDEIKNINTFLESTEGKKFLDSLVEALEYLRKDISSHFPTNPEEFYSMVSGLLANAELESSTVLRAVSEGPQPFTYIAPISSATRTLESSTVPFTTGISLVTAKAG